MPDRVRTSEGGAGKPLNVLLLTLGAQRDRRLA
jgi:hypothetical protein